MSTTTEKLTNLMNAGRKVLGTTDKYNVEKLTTALNSFTPSTPTTPVSKPTNLLSLSSAIQSVKGLDQQTIIQNISDAHLTAFYQGGECNISTQPIFNGNAMTGDFDIVIRNSSNSASRLSLIQMLDSTVQSHSYVMSAQITATEHSMFNFISYESPSDGIQDVNDVIDIPSNQPTDVIYTTNYSGMIVKFVFGAGVRIVVQPGSQVTIHNMAYYDVNDLIKAVNN